MINVLFVHKYLFFAVVAFFVKKSPSLIVKTYQDHGRSKSIFSMVYVGINDIET